MDGVDLTELHVDTTGREVVDLTDDAEEFCRGRGDGLLSVFAPHATAGVAIMETGSGSDEDLPDLLDRLLPRATATGTATAHRATAGTTSCPCSSHPR
jgi:thiamine phosphate synthase YjbQ (UPF0047 family)